jgi:arsenite methyltransferase
MVRAARRRSARRASTSWPALLVGERGRAIGIDLTPAMIEKAKGVAGAVGLVNVAFYVASMESVPLPDGAADVVISNGAINLSSHKPCVFKEVYRILRPGGRLQFADMVRTAAADAMSRGSWADCVSGTVEPERYLDMLKAAGFEQAEFVGFTVYKTAPTTIGATFRAYKK